MGLGFIKTVQVQPGRENLLQSALAFSTADTPGEACQEGVAAAGRFEAGLVVQSIRFSCVLRRAVRMAVQQREVFNACIAHHICFGQRLDASYAWYQYLPR